MNTFIIFLYLDFFLSLKVVLIFAHVRGIFFILVAVYLKVTLYLYDPLLICSRFIPVKRALENDQRKTRTENTSIIITTITPWGLGKIAAATLIFIFTRKEISPIQFKTKDLSRHPNSKRWCDVKL